MAAASGLHSRGLDLYHRRAHGVRSRASRARREGGVKLGDVAVDNSRWPDEVRKVNNNYNNQFELPVLFHAILPLLLMLVRWMAAVSLAWVFVASRILHSLIHTGSNIVMQRGLAFVVGFIAIGG